MTHEKSIVLAINDPIIALDVEDLIQSHFNHHITTLTIFETQRQINQVNPEIMIVDCDIYDPNLGELINTADTKPSKLICFCTSKEQSKNLKNDKTEVLLKPFDNDELKSIIERFSNTHNKLAAEEIASGP